MNKSQIWMLLSYFPLGLIGLGVAGLASMWLTGGMTRISAWYLLQIALPGLGLVSLIYAVIRLFWIRKSDRVVIFTGLAAVMAMIPALLMVFPVTYPADLERTTPAAVVRLPADVPLKVAWGGNSIEVNYHAAVPDQRWAYDFLVEPFLVGSTVLTDYGCYGVPVVAPAAGVITSAHDGEPEMTPGEVSNNYAAPSGNHVVILLDETGTYLLIAHLKLDSVSVKPGERVAEGQIIGQCGNSGNTSEPHIHIHHQRQNPAEYPNNFAEGLPLYFRDHDGEAMPEGGYTFVADQVVLTGATVTHQK